MKIVIDIPKEMYATLNNIPMGTISVLEALYAIKNGTPLPKRHGRLIDADAFVKKYERDKGRRIYVDNFIFDLEMNAPTIVGADKEAKDAESNN